MMKDVRDIIGKGLKVVLPLGVSAAMIIWLLHKVDIARVDAVLHQGVDFGYIAAMMAITLLSHAIRGYRWGMQLRAAGIPRIPLMAEVVSIWSAYALNLLIPYIGEAWRCVYISRRERCPLSTVVGTDLGDRASDGIMIGLLVCLTLIVAHPQLMRFVDHYSLGRELVADFSSMVLWAGVAAALIIIGLLAYLMRRSKFIQGAIQSVKRLYSGFAVLFHMKGIGLYGVLTVAIWTCYFMETYLCFFAFPFTRELITSPGTCWGLLPGLIVFVFGSCSMIVPSNGGLGPWNIAVMFALSLCGVADADGAAYSLVCWSCQSATYVAAGIFSAGYIMVSRRRSDTVKDSLNK